MKLHLRRIISGKGSAPDKFAGALRGLAVDPSGWIYAAGDREVKVFGAGGELRRRWRTAKFGHCLAFNRQGDVYVGQDGQVEQFRADGGLAATFRDPGRLGKVTAIGFLGDQLLLGDATNRCIRRYNGQGVWMNDIGSANNTRGLLIPNGRLEFAVGAEGIIQAINSAKHRVERYRPEGALLGHFGRFGMRRPEDFPGCCNPTNLALIPGGRLAVTEKAPPRVKIYDSQGQLVALAGSGAFHPNCKNMAVAADAAGRIYVADTVRLQICVFEPSAGQLGGIHRSGRTVSAGQGASAR